MDRPVPNPAHVRTDLPGAAAAPQADPSVPPLSPAAPSSGRGPRIALFVWASAFGFLFTYELIYTLFKLLKIRQ